MKTGVVASLGLSLDEMMPESNPQTRCKLGTRESQWSCLRLKSEQDSAKGTEGYSEL